MRLTRRLVINSMQTNLYFVRHAHSIYTPDELARPLSKQGLADAEKVTRILKTENIDCVISSPYNRAIQTVEGIARLVEKAIIIETDFKERTLSVGPVDDFEAAITKLWKEPSFCWDGGESNVVAQKRGVAATLRVLKKYAGQNIVIGTHGNIMVLIMNYFEETYDFDFWKKLDMPDVYKLTFEDLILKEVEHLSEGRDGTRIVHTLK